MNARSAGQPSPQSDWIARAITDALFTQSPLSTALYDVSGRVMLANPAFEAHFGVRVTAIRPDYSLFTDVQLRAAGAVPAIRQAFAGDAVVLPPIQYDVAELAGGTRRVVWSQWHCHPVRDASGAVTHLAVIHVDVTRWAEVNATLREVIAERDGQAARLELAAEELRERTQEADAARRAADSERARAEDILENMVDAHCVLDVDFRFVAVNKAMERGVGIPRAELIGRSMWELFPGTVGTAFEENYLRARREGVEVHFTSEYTDARLTLVVEVDAYPTPRGIVVFWRDVTARERTATALKASETQLRTLADAIPTLAWTAQADGYIDWYNARWYEYTGTTPEQMMGWGWQSVHDPAVLPEVLEHWTTSISTGEPFEMTFPLLGADGVFRPFLTRVIPLKDMDGRVVRWFGTNTDVEAERAARDAAERAARRTEQLQAVTAALAGSRTTDDVAAIVVAEGVAATGARTAALMVRIPGTDDARIVRQSGVTPGVAERFSRFPLSSNMPAAVCLRTGEPVWIEARTGPDGLVARFPEVADTFASLGVQALATVPLVAAGEIVGAMTFTFECPRTYTPEDRAFFLALGRQTAQAIERARLSEAERDAAAEAESGRRRLAFLADASAALGESLDYEATLVRAVRLAVPAIADYAIVDVAAEDGGVRRLSEAHRDPALGAVLEETARYFDGGRAPDHPLQRALDTGLATLIPEMTEEWVQRVARAPGHLALIRTLAPKSAMMVPLRARDRIVGLLTLVSSSSGRRFTRSDLALAEEFARRAGVAADNARLFADAEAARQRAEAANKIKSDFLAVMSHELRTPLNAIAGYAELLDLGIHGPVTPEQRDALARIQRSQRNLLGLINDVLNFAKLEAGHLEYRFAAVSVAEAVDSLESLVEPQLRAKSLRYDREACRDANGDVVRVRADAEKMKQVLVNLLSNAIKFTPAGGAITVSLRVVGDRVEIAVADTGIGIATDRLEQVFEPFVQIDRQLNAPQEGTGLGLAISRELARGMGGDLTVQSALGRGSTFTLTLQKAGPEDALSS